MAIDDAERFLRKNLIGFDKDANECYSYGRYTGCTKTLIEGFLAVAGGSFFCAASHAKGQSKRFKCGDSSRSTIYFQQLNGNVPIVFCGYPFEVIKSEKWLCNESAPANKFRTARLYKDFGLPMDDTAEVTQVAKDDAKDRLLEALHANKPVKYEDIHYFRFPLGASHTNHDMVSRTNTTQLDKRVINKVRELVRNGICDVPSLKSMISDYVLNTLFADSGDNEKPRLDNKRFFPTTKTIHNHIFLASSKATSLPKASSSEEVRAEDMPPTSVTNIVQVNSQPYCDLAALRCRKIDVGFIALHVGAGYHSDERYPGYNQLCKMVCTAVSRKIREGVSAGEATALAVQMLEDSELTNAGYGSNLTESGQVECDASVMDTSPSSDPTNRCDSYFGSVACVSKVKNPVRAAYKILSEQRRRSRLELGRIPPSFMVSAGAENWAKAHGVKMCESGDLVSESALKSWQKYHQRLLEKLARNRRRQEGYQDRERMDTVGAVALDLNGNVASAVSSGGIILKMPGRVGQAAVYGCGCWAEPGRGDSPSVAVTASGCGEQLVSTMLSKNCAERLRNHDQPYQALQDALVKDFLGSPMLNAECEKQAGLLCLHHCVDGPQNVVEVVWGHTTSSMVISHMSTTDKNPQVILSRLPSNAVPGKSVTVGGSWTKVSSSEEPAVRPSLGANGDEILSSISPAVADGLAMFDGLDNPGCSSDENELDPEISIMFASPLKSGVPFSMCKVAMSEEFNRKVDPEFEKCIADRWERRKQQNARLFNAQKFRIHSVRYTCNGGDAQLTFNVGLTCYRDYMETNWAAEVEELKAKGAKHYNQTQAYLAEPLGVAGIVITDDDKAIFQWRNLWLAESAGQLDVPGGHPEPSAAAGLEIHDFVSFDELDGDGVSREIFHSQVKEIRDEVNVSVEKIGEPMLMGLVRNNLSAGRAVAYFLMRCHLTSTEVLQSYRKGGAETDESTNLHFISEQDVADMKSKHPDLWSKMCPNGKAACTLYGILKSYQ